VNWWAGGGGGGGHTRRQAYREKKAFAKKHINEQ
jgi:hypothetical protein